MEKLNLHLSPLNKKIGGVCGGIAESIGIDATIVRVIAVALLIVTNAVFAIAYFVLWAVLPEE